MGTSAEVPRDCRRMRLMFVLRLSDLVHQRHYLLDMSTPAQRQSYRNILFSRPPASLQRKDDVPPPIPSFPLDLSDRHIPYSLTLKRVCFVPSLHIDICSALDTLSDELDSLPDHLYAYPTGFYRDVFRADAETVCDIREVAISLAARYVASSLFITKTQPSVFPLLLWRTPDQHEDTKNTFMLNNFNLRVMEPTNLGTPNLNDTTLSVVNDLLKYTPVLITGMMFCSDGHGLLDAMCDAEVHEPRDFPWRFDSNPRKMPPPGIIPADAPESLLELPGIVRKQLRRSYRVLERSDPAGRRVPAATVLGICEWLKMDRESYEPSPEDYIQKVRADVAFYVVIITHLQAWTSAVQSNTTLIVFDCGNFFRFGIRHRETQTLFLSALIDCQATDPAYGKIWTALHIIAVFDAIQRVPSLKSESEYKSMRQKRKAKWTELDSRKRQRVDEDSQDALERVRWC